MPVEHRRRGRRDRGAAALPSWSRVPLPWTAAIPAPIRFRSVGVSTWAPKSRIPPSTIAARPAGTNTPTAIAPGISAWPSSTVGVPPSPLAPASLSNADRVFAKRLGP